MTNIIFPTIKKPAIVVNEKNMLKKRYSTAKGSAVTLKSNTLERYKSSFYWSFAGDFVPILLIKLLPYILLFYSCVFY